MSITSPSGAPRFLATAALLALTPIVAIAGTTGSISGVVSDSNPVSSPVADARVTITSSAQIESAKTDARGQYAFASLAPGRYVVLVEKSGWNPLTIGGVIVVADQTLRLDPHMTLASIAIVRMDGPFSFFGLSMGLGAGRIPDYYSYGVYRQSVVGATQVNIQWLRFTPGITFAPGNAAPSSPL